MQKALPLAAPAAASEGPLAGLFHPAVADWFTASFGMPTPVQQQAWQVTARHRNALITAPTGSGKTLAAFLAAINDLVSEGIEQGLADETQVLYISPLKALSNDIRKNLDAPLAGIAQRARELGLGELTIRTAVRTGDTSAIDRQRMKKVRPHILVTTPESLFILLSSDAGRDMLRTVRSVIVDELHAVAGSKRGAHLALSLERLDALCERPPLRIGLSATQKPIETMAGLLMGSRGNSECPVDIRPRERPDRECLAPARSDSMSGRAGQTWAGGRKVEIGLATDGVNEGSTGIGLNIVNGCVIVDAGHTRDRDLALELPRSPLSAVMSTEVWGETYDRLAELVNEHRTTLIFVNQRRQAERVARHLAERIGEDFVTAHHGSLAKEHRLDAEQRLKAGKLRALVATASLELGIDIGDIDLVCQLGSPRSINAFLQRVGRAGHAVRATPKGRLFPLSLDDLAECAALMEGVRRGELDRVIVPDAPMDVLAQQIVAEAACADWSVDELHARFARALPYADLTLQRFEEVVQMLADGYVTRRGRRGALLHYDAVNRRLRGRRGAKLTTVTNAGTIPDQFDSEVELVPEGVKVGTLNEDFAFESLPGDIVQLGNTSYRIIKIETGRVLVEDAKGQPPTMPFWLGEGLGRSDELSTAVSKLRTRADAVFGDDIEAGIEWLKSEYDLDGVGAAQLANYYGSARTALGLLPTRDKIVFERFFDEVGDTHLVIHAPLGSRVMRAWGLALRKRFCRQFNFELQAAALDDSLVLSLGPTHSFPLEEVAHYLHSNSAREVLTQAVLQAPMFGTRWRWVASTALAVARNRNGKRVPPQWQRSDAEDLLTHAFPDAVACQDNLPGDREVPDHPLVHQALEDCLHEVMDIDGFIALLRRIESGAVEIVCRDLTAPSPLSDSILTAKPYAFLDDAPAEERRTLTVRTGGFAEAASARDLGELDSAAIARVREEMRPEPMNEDELHDALVVHGFLTDDEARAWPTMLANLKQARRVVRLCIPCRSGDGLWVAAERLREMRVILADAHVDGDAPELGAPIDADTALRELMRSRLELHGPVTATVLGAPLGLSADAIAVALLALEQQGYVMRGTFTPEAIAARDTEWCERRRLARIHRYTRDRKRAEFQPVPAAAFMRFLFDWQGLVGREKREGPAALELVLAQLEGFPVAASAWETEILPARTRWYEEHWLDQLCASGRVIWQRPPGSGDSARKSAPVRATPIVLLPREFAGHWQSAPDAEPELSGPAHDVLAALRANGASFFVDLVADTDRLRSEVEDALGELVSHGLITADGFAGLRALVAPAEIKARRLRRGGVRAAFQNLESAGRWTLVRARKQAAEDATKASDDVEHIARVLLKRYGVVFRKLVEREPQLPPWRELFYVLRRLEARGEIRGGRFVSGFSGEQFALPEAAGSLRRFREEKDDDLVVVCGSDPLNLTGVIVPGDRVPALPGNRILFRNGAPVAVSVGGNVKYLARADEAMQWAWRNKLIRRGDGARPLDSAGAADDPDADRDGAAAAARR